MFGLVDLPAVQQQQSAVLALDAFTHLMAAGAPRSGRSQLLRTIAGALALTHSSADVHLYGIDCGNGALLPLAELPHCGAVVSRAQTERAARLLKRLAAELSRRQELLAAAGFGDIREQRAAAAEAERLPHIFVLLDRWEGFTATLGELEAGSLTEILTRLLTEGASVGMHLVMTGDRSLLLGRISSLCEEKLIFKLAEKDDYRLAGLNPRDLPDDLPPGRAFRAGSGTELQVALLAPDASGQGQAAALQAIAAHCRSRDAAVPADAAAVPGGRAAVARVIRRRLAAAAGLRRAAVGPGRGGRRHARGARAGPRLRDALLHRGRPGQIGAVHHPAVHGEIVPRGRNTGRAGRAAAVPAARTRRRTWRAGSVRPAGAGRSRTRRSPCRIHAGPVSS